MTIEASELLREVERRRRNILELAALQTQMREALQDRFDRSGETLTAYARKYGLHNARAKRFLEGDLVVTRGQMLAGVLDAIERPDLTSKIEKLTAGIADREAALAGHPKDVIDAHYDLRKLYSCLRDTYETEVIASAFGEYADVFAGTVTQSSTAVTALHDDSVRTAIRHVLERGDLDDRIAVEYQRIEAAKQKKASRLSEILDLMSAAGFDARRKQAEELGIYWTTLNNALQARGSTSTVEQVLARAEAWCAQCNTEEAPNGADPAEAFVTDQQSTSLIEQHGGGSSPEGVRFTVSASSFHEVDWDPSDGFVEWLKRTLEMARAALNSCAQIKNEASREKIRGQVAAEVMELELAIRLFSDRFPNRLTELHDAQRKTWSNKGRNGGSK